MSALDVAAAELAAALAAAADVLGPSFVALALDVDGPVDDIAAALVASVPLATTPSGYDLCRCGHSQLSHGRFYGRIGAGGRWSDHCRSRGCDCARFVDVGDGRYVYAARWAIGEATP